MEILSIVKKWERRGKIQISVHTPQNLPGCGLCLMNEQVFHYLPAKLLGIPRNTMSFHTFSYSICIECNALFHFRSTRWILHYLSVLHCQMSETFFLVTHIHITISSESCPLMWHHLWTVYVGDNIHHTHLYFLWDNYWSLNSVRTKSAPQLSFYPNAPCAWHINSPQ